MSLNKYDCHIANITHTAIYTTGIQNQHFWIHVPKHNQVQYLLHMLSLYMGQQQICISICNIYNLVQVHIWHNYFSTNTSYELNTINNVTRSTAIHTFHIIGICPWTNMPAPLHINVPLHYYCHLQISHISTQKTSTSLYHVIVMYVPTTNMHLKCHIWHIPKFLNVHQSEGSRLIYMEHMNSLASTWWGVLYTKENGAQPNNDDSATWLD